MQTLLWHRVRIWSQEQVSVEVNHVIGKFGDPDLRFPRNLRKKFLHYATSLKSGDEYQTRSTSSEQVLEFLAPLTVNRASARNRFDKQQPVLRQVVDDHIRRFGGRIQIDSQSR